MTATGTLVLGPDAGGALAERTDTGIGCRVDAADD